MIYARSGKLVEIDVSAQHANILTHPSGSQQGESKQKKKVSLQAVLDTFTLRQPFLQTA